MVDNKLKAGNPYFVNAPEAEEVTGLLLGLCSSGGEPMLGETTHVPEKGSYASPSGPEVDGIDFAIRLEPDSRSPWRRSVEILVHVVAVRNDVGGGMRIWFVRKF